MRNLWILALATALISCGDQPYDPDAPAIDPDAPRVHIVTPARGSFAGDARQLVVTGTASDDTAVRAVQVNGVAAVLAADGSWQATVPAAIGTQLIQAVATDADGHTGKESRAVVVGAVRPIADPVPEAITASISAQTFEALGRGLADALRSGRAAALAASLNPIVDVGDGPDCNYVQASVTGITAGPATTVALVGRPGGLAIDVELDRVAVRVHLAYAVLCGDGARDVTVTARHVRITGGLDVGIAGGNFNVALVDQEVVVTGVEVDLGGVPGEIASALHLDTALGPLLGVVAERLAVPRLNRALAGLAQARSVDVFGTAIDIRVTPAWIAFDTDGATLELDTSLRARGDAGARGYVAVGHEAPAASTARGFQLAVAADAANQLLASWWAAGGFELGFDLTTGEYGQLGRLYDRVELSAKVPPFVAARAGGLTLVIGDLMATFKRGAAIATQIAVNVQVDLRVVIGDDGAPRLDVGTPITYVDVLDEGIAGANSLSNAQFEAVTSFALGRAIAVGSGAVGAVPLPALGEVAMQELRVTEASGYLIVAGRVE